jgi:hypothetical protein
MSSGAHLPPGWPPAVRPPGAPHWERSAVGWMLDLCPPEYRGHAVVTRHPALLAWLAGHHVDGQLQGTRRALATARSELAEVLPPPALREAVEAIEQEEARLVAARRALALLGDALRGVRYVPRL